MSIAQLICKAEENSKWFSANYRRLTNRYDGKWVAILDKKVIDYDRNLRKLVARLRKKLNKRYTEAAIEYVTKKPVYMVLVV